MFRKKTLKPLNIPLQEAINHVFDLYRQGDIESQFKAVLTLIEKIGNRHYDNIPFGRDQYSILNRMIKTIEKRSPAEYHPFALVLYALFTARKGESDSLQQAHRLFEEIHQLYPNNVFALKKHLELCGWENESTIKYQADLLSRLQFASRLSPSRYVAPIVLTKPANDTFNPIVGSNRPLPTFFSRSNTAERLPAETDPTVTNILTWG